MLDTCVISSDLRNILFLLIKCEQTQLSLCRCISVFLTDETHFKFCFRMVTDFDYLQKTLPVVDLSLLKVRNFAGFEHKLFLDLVNA